MLRLGLSAFLGLILAASVSGQGTGKGTGVPGFELDSTNFPIAVPDGYHAVTGYLVVLEDRERPDGPTIRLPVAVLKARDGRAEPGPVLYLSGGPGTSALNAASYPGAYPWTTNRNFVVFGQRGTHYAQPALMCPDFAEARSGASFSSLAEASLEVQITSAARCRETLESEGIDLAAYSTAASAADIEDLRRVLGIHQWTLYGVSYGTRLALAVLRDFPGTVRAAVLDSPLPPQVRFDDESAANLESALDIVFRDCAASTGCREAFPDLRERFRRALAAADVSPVVVTVSDENDRKPLALAGADLASLVSLGSSGEISNAPYLLDAIARRDTSVIGPAVARSFGSSNFAWGMRLSVWCGEALPYSARAVAQEPRRELAGLESAVVLPGVCEAWGVASRPEREVVPVESDVPTLLIAGEYDAATPPKWAYEAAKTLWNGRVVIVRAAGHTPTQEWGGDGCAMRLANAFVSSPTSSKSDLDIQRCLSARMPDFLLRNP